MRCEVEDHRGVGVVSCTSPLPPTPVSSHYFTGTRSLFFYTAGERHRITLNLGDLTNTSRSNHSITEASETILHANRFVCHAVPYLASSSTSHLLLVTIRRRKGNM